MVAAESYSLNNECVPNNEVLHISSYRSFHYTRQTHQHEHERQGGIVAHGDKKPSTAWKASYVATTCTNIFGLPALVSGFLFVSIWGMRTSHIILCCFGDKRCEMVGHVPTINCSAMIVVFV